MLAVDHVLVSVADLEQSMAAFTALGFTVQRGGEHDHTHNALIIFNDHSYIELLSLKATWYRPFLRMLAKCGLLGAVARYKKTFSWRTLHWITQAYGAIDWCLRTDDLDANINRLAVAGVPLLTCQQYQRRRPDGQQLWFRLGSARDRDLPFLVQDESSLYDRVPIDGQTQHANGACGIRQITLSVKNVEQAQARWSTLMSCEKSPWADTGIVFTADADFVGKYALKLAYDGQQRIGLDASGIDQLAISLLPSGEQG